MKSLMMTTASAVLTSGVIFNAYWQKRQFYPSVVYLTKSNASLAVLYLQAFVLVLLAGKLARRIFFGQLRTIEMEHLIERSWYAVTETCLAFTVFRDDLSPKFVCLFTILLFLKCFHWLAEDRVDVMERSPNISWVFHTRLLSLLTLLSIADVAGVKLAYDTTTAKGPSVQLVFGFEYAILLISVLHVAIKYLLHVVDYIRANQNRGDAGGNNRNWEDKAVYLLYSELFLSGSKVILYAAFVALMMKFLTFPLFALRPMYLSVRSLKKAANDVIKSRAAIRTMNSRYPNASAQELQETDNVCIICREEMIGTTLINGQVVDPPSGLSKKLPCGHIFHVSCLRSWFQRQQTCPTCRLDVLRAARNTPGPENNNVNVNLFGNRGVAGAGVGAGAAGVAVDAAQQQQLMQQMFLTHLFLNQLQAAAGGNVNNNNNNQAPTSANSSDPSRTTSAAADSTNTAASAPDNASTSTTTTRTATATVFPPVNIPGFLTMPSPPANVDLSSLTDDELRILIRSEREGLEARLRLYSQSRVLIDAAITNLLQFNSLLNSTVRIIPSSSSGVSAAAAAASSNNDPRSEDQAGVRIPSDLIDRNSREADNDGRVLSEEEIIRRRTNSDVRRARMSKFAEESPSHGPSSSTQAGDDKRD